MINFSPFLLAEWEEEKKRMLVAVNSSQHSLSDPDVSIDTYTTSLLFERVLLRDGYGFRGLAEYIPTYLITDETDSKNYNSYFLSLQTVAFLSSTSDLSFGVHSSDSFTPFSNGLLTYINLKSDSTTERKDSFDFNYSVGKDKAFFYWNTSARHVKSDITDLTSKHLLQEFIHSIVESEFLWRQSEDTLWGGKLVYSDKTRNQLENIQTTSVTNLFLTNVTKILKATQLQTNLGLTQAANKQSFAWDIKQNTFITDYFSFSFSTRRQFDLSAESKFDNELITRHSFSSQYSPVDYWSASLGFNKEKRTVNNIKTISTQALSIRSSISYKDTWSISLGVSAEELTQHRTDQYISQYKADISVSKVIL